MSVDNLEIMCKTRSEKSKLIINYNAKQFDPEADIKSAFRLDKKGLALALAQLGVINQYLKDFNDIIKNVEEDKAKRPDKNLLEMHSHPHEEHPVTEEK